MKVTPFVHFIVHILFHKSHSVQTVLSFKILNDVAVCIVRSEIVNLDHEMNTLHFISNGEDTYPNRMAILIRYKTPIISMQNFVLKPIKEIKIGIIKKLKLEGNHNVFYSIFNLFSFFLTSFPSFFSFFSSSFLAIIMIAILKSQFP